ncbi:MAG: D-tyrosyl-tRNA(Tyr) deacylase [Lentisphaerae bacterium]|nr:D-tyrosyl-tRNA(Tyr) deacylase [Lentisphaerota bacterium]
MKVLIQRVARASVCVGGETVGRTGPGLMVLVGVRAGDTAADAAQLAQKTVALRIFPDAADRMNLSVEDTGGGVLAVSQFTLYAETRKGNRPSFVRAAGPDLARALYGEYVEALRRALGPDRVATGVFGASMQVELVNDGPVTVELSTDPAPARQG